MNSVAFGTVVTQMTEVIRGKKFAAQTFSRIPLGHYGETAGVAASVLFLMIPGLPRSRAKTSPSTAETTAI